MDIMAPVGMVRWDGQEKSSIDELDEETRQALRIWPRPQQNTHLDVSLVSRFCEIRGGDERLLAIHYDALRMQPVLQRRRRHNRSRVVVESWQGAILRPVK